MLAQLGHDVSYGEIDQDMRWVLEPLLDGKTVYDLGAGDLTHSHMLVELGAKAVVAVDKAPMPTPRYPEITRAHGHLGEVPIPEHVEVAFLCWPQTYPMPGLLDWLDAAEVVVYIGHNFDGDHCGQPELFFYMTGRALEDEVVGRRNTMLVLRDHLAELRPMTPEEAAHFSVD
jgi:hypothetical protein